jgi:hypothetical protein
VVLKDESSYVHLKNPYNVRVNNVASPDFSEITSAINCQLWGKSTLARPEICGEENASVKLNASEQFDWQEGNSARLAWYSKMKLHLFTSCEGFTLRVICEAHLPK